MKNLALLLPLFAIAACSSETAPEAAPTATAAPVASATPSLPAPDQASFTKLFTEACPDAEPINEAICKRAGMGSPEVICEYSLGEDEYLRNSATLVAGDTAWSLKEPEAICTKTTDTQAG